MFILTDEKYGAGIVLDEYQGTYSLVCAKNKDGEIYNQWCKAKRGRDEYANKDIPLGVRLGNRDEAIERLQEFLDELKHEAPSIGLAEDDIPF